MRQRLLALLIALSLLGLPVLALGAAPAQAGTTPYQTRVVVLDSAPGSQLYKKDFQILVQLQGYTGSEWVPLADPGHDLTLQRRLAGTSSWRTVATQEASATDSRALFATKVVGNAAYRVDYAGGTYSSNPASTFAPSTSTAKTVKVFRDFGAKSRKLRGSKYLFSGKLSPSYKKKPVVLQRNTGGRWVTIARAKSTKQSRWSFTVAAKPSRGTWRYRAFTPKGQQFQKSYSATLKLCTNVACG